MKSSTKSVALALMGGAAVVALGLIIGFPMRSFSEDGDMLKHPLVAAARKEPAGSKASARKGADRLELDPTDITGNRELPKVLYIVPWKRSDLGDLLGKPAHSLLDDVLQPLDRDVFQRENRYYDALKPEQAAPGAGAVPGSGDKP